MEHQHEISEIVRNSAKAISCFIYDLDGYKSERIVTFAPISKGDFVTVKLTDGTFLRDKEVEKVSHYSHVVNIEKQMLTSMITLKD